MSRGGLGRRGFLASGLAAPFLRPLRSQNAQAPPHYRSETPLDRAVANLRPGSDEFPIEREHDRIAQILAAWSTGLRQSPPDFRPIENALTANFLGTSLKPAESRTLRHDAALEVRQLAYAQPATGNIDRSSFNPLTMHF